MLSSPWRGLPHASAMRPRSEGHRPRDEPPPAPRSTSHLVPETPALAGQGFLGHLDNKPSATQRKEVVARASAYPLPSAVLGSSSVKLTIPHSSRLRLLPPPTSFPGFRAARNRGSRAPSLLPEPSWGYGFFSLVCPSGSNPESELNMHGWSARSPQWPSNRVPLLCGKIGARGVFALARPPPGASVGPRGTSEVGEPGPSMDHS